MAKKHTDAQTEPATPTSVTPAPTTDDYLEHGYAVRKDAAGFHVTSPDGEHGSGVSVHDAVLNIGAQILPNNETQRRELIRRDGTVIPL